MEKNLNNKKVAMTNVFDLFKNSFGLYKEKFSILLSFILFNILGYLLSIPLILIFGIVAIIFSPQILTGNLDLNTPIIVSGILLFLIWLIILIIISIWTRLSLMTVLNNENEIPNIKDILRKTWGQIGLFL